MVNTIKIKKNLREFENIIKMVGKISYETDYCFSSDEIKIRAVNASNTSLGIFYISKEMFDEYDIEKEQILTIKNKLFEKLIKKVGKTELNIDFLEDAIQLSNKKDKYNLKFFVGQKDDRPDPNFDCTSVWNMEANEFTKVINELSKLGEVCCFDGKEKLTIKVKSTMVEGETITSAQQIRNDNCHCFYYLEYIIPIVDINNLFKNIRIEFGAEMPLIVKGKNEHLKFVFILAPRGK